MLTPQFLLPLHGELVVDLFAGGGGASTGIEQALGRPVDVAINHDREAVAMHEANHPQTRHYVSDVFEVDPLSVTQGRPVGLLWASPDCTYHSKARGGKPHRDRGQANRRRALAGIVVRWAKAARPRVICLENVEEFRQWGPLDASGRPCPRRRGQSFDRWAASLRNLGYRLEWRELRACDYGAPTIRRRLFLVARCDGAPIVWPAPTHGAPDSLPVRQGKMQPWRTAAECIDWSLPAPSIFERARPLADATCRRIAKGIVRHVIESAEPFIVTNTTGHPGAPVSEPLRTITTAGNQMLVTPFVAPLTHAGTDRAYSITDPLRTVTTAHRGETALVVSTLVQVGYGERKGQSPRVPGLDNPLGTVVCASKHAMVSAFLAKHYTGTDSHSQAQPGQDRADQVQAFLVSYYGTDQSPDLRRPMPTVSTKDRLGLVLVRGQPYRIVDIGLRMLTPRELYRAQGFPPDYVIDRRADGTPITKTAQVRMCGNSVCPPVARALVAANYKAAEMRRAA